MWDLSGSGIEPVSPALAGGFLTSVPPGKSLLLYYYHYCIYQGLVLGLFFFLIKIQGILSQNFNNQLPYIKDYKLSYLNSHSIQITDAEIPLYLIAFRNSLLNMNLSCITIHHPTYLL